MAQKLVVLAVFTSFFLVALSGTAWNLSNVFHKQLILGLGTKTLDSKENFSYNETLAHILVEYASAVYINDLDDLINWTCSRCGGLTKGFQVVELIVDIQHCLQAFVGVAGDLRSIVVAFRGTQENSMQNWAEDLYFKQLDLNYPGVTGAAVHKGFYYAYHNTSLGYHVVEAVKSIQKIDNSLQLTVVGHSMGGAMAAFCALDMTLNHGVKDIQVITFGQPRIGNSIFAAYYNTLVPNTYRMTHDHDMVPHLPPYYTFFPTWTYHHFPREIWIHKPLIEDDSDEIHQVCDGSGEDPTCSRSVKGNSIIDHLSYMGVELAAEGWSPCHIVLSGQDVSDEDGTLVIQRPFNTPWRNATTIYFEKKIVSVKYSVCLCHSICNSVMPFLCSILNHLSVARSVP